MGFLEVEWPFLVCIAEVALCVLAALFVISKFEAPLKREKIREGPAFLDRNDIFFCCSGRLHPGWLCAFRAFAFSYLLTVQIYDIVVDGFVAFMYYTQWTFTVLIIYFGVATYVSIKEILQHNDAKRKTLLDEESGEEKEVFQSSDNRRLAGLLGYATLGIFQVAAAATTLTDMVYWFILVPFMVDRPWFDITFVNLNMHAVNGVILLIELFLNSMPFPWFRGAYFVLWTAIYVIFQWIVHGVGFISWWPYPFLEVTTRYAPIWYLGMAIGHVIAFLICLAVAKFKKPVVSYLSHCI